MTGPARRRQGVLAVGGGMKRPEGSEGGVILVGGALEGMVGGGGVAWKGKENGNVKERRNGKEKGNGNGNGKGVPVWKGGRPDGGGTLPTLPLPPHPPLVVRGGGGRHHRGSPSTSVRVSRPSRPSESPSVPSKGFLNCGSRRGGALGRALPEAGPPSPGPARAAAAASPLRGAQGRRRAILVRRRLGGDRDWGVPWRLEEDSDI